LFRIVATPIDGARLKAELEDPGTGKRERLDDEEILAFARIMLPAGAGTTYRGLGCFLLGLLQTGQLEKLREKNAESSAVAKPAV